MLIETADLHTGDSHSKIKGPTLKQHNQIVSPLLAPLTKYFRDKLQELKGQIAFQSQHFASVALNCISFSDTNAIISSPPILNYLSSPIPFFDL